MAALGGRYRRLVVAAAALVALASASPAPAVPFEKSRNVRFVKNFFYLDGTDLDFRGDYVYAGRLGLTSGAGVHIIDVSGGKPRRAGFVACPGDQNDVAVVRPGLLAMGYHEGYCGRGREGGGVRLVDVSNPRRPRPLDDINLDGGTHTLTAYPGKPLIYASPGGHANGMGVESILDASNPRRLKVAARFTPNPMGCHDLSFHVSRKRNLAFCAATHETQIWNVSKPRAPRTIGRIVNPFVWFHHSAVASPDGKLLVVGDEAFAAHECVTGGPTGSMWIYNISDPTAPELVGHIGPVRGSELVGGAVDGPVSQWCTAHNYNFVPGTRVLVSAWFTGGTRVIDLKNPSSPREIAYFRPLNANAWSSYWYRGRIYINDINRGLDVIDVKGLGGDR